jgi:hypothetical protein
MRFRERVMVVRPALINDPDRWHLRAEETRTLVEEMTDPQARDTMLMIADGYDRLAKCAQAKMLTGSSKSRPRAPRTFEQDA